MPCTRAPTSTGLGEGLLAEKVSRRRISSVPRRAAERAGSRCSRSPGGRAACHAGGEAAGDDGEQVVEVVGEAAGELADGFHLLGLDEARPDWPLSAVMSMDSTKKPRTPPTFNGGWGTTALRWHRPKLPAALVREYS